MATSFVATSRLLAPSSTPRGPQSVAEVLRRVQLSRRQAKRRQDKQTQKYRSDTERERRQERASQLKVGSNRLKEARRVRKENFELGPLAPRRDVGKFGTTYGVVDPKFMQVIDVPSWQHKWCPFAMGDRVVLLSGKDKGKIGIVDNIDEDSQSIKVKNLNLYDMHIPEWMQQDQTNKQEILSIEKNLPFDALRLVFPLSNPNTGEKRDVIVEKLERRVDWIDYDTNEVQYKRVIPELDDYEVPWPPTDESELPEGEDDTLRINVEKETFQGPALTLLGLPMPPTVIDELRNKYSKTSNRRLKDPEYMAKIRDREEQNRQKNLDMMVAMRTPLQELHALRAEEKKKEQAVHLADGDMAELNDTYMDIREGKPWRRKQAYDVKEAWKKAWNEEKTLAKQEGRTPQRPSKIRQKNDIMDEAFLESLGALMAEKGLDGSKKSARQVVMAQ